MMRTLFHDLRYAARALARTPGVTIAALVSIALGVGANTALFSVASALLLRPLPYADPNRLVILWNRSPGLGITKDWFSTAQYFDILGGQHAFEQVAIAIGGNENLTGAGEPERVGTIRTSSNLLPMLGARAELGHLFDRRDDLPGSAGRAVLGHGTWIRRFGGDPNVIGRTLTLNGRPFQVAGVLPASFDLPREVMPTLGGAEHAEIVLPLPLAADAARVRNGEDFNIVARLKPGVAAEQAQVQLDALTARLRREHPDFYPPNGGLTFGVVPLHEEVVGDVRQSLRILLAAVGFVLLIACANVANLLLTRAVSRRREIAVRAALGASSGRIVGQLLTESLLLSILGGALGLLVALWGLGWLRELGPASIPRLLEVGIDGRVLLFAAAISMASGVLFGLAPAWRAARPDVQDALRESGRGVASGNTLWGRGHNTRRLLVVAELALSAMLLIAAGLLIRSFARVQEVPPGFNPRHVLTLELTMAGRKYANAAIVIEAYRELWRRLERLPGVTATGGVSALPLSNMMSWGPITVEGRTPVAGEKFINVDIRTVSGDYFRAMEIPLRRGRVFTPGDTRDQPRVVVIDEQMARQLWPGQDAVGKRIRTGGFDITPDTPWMTVVGVVGRIKQDALDADSRMALYRPHSQFPGRALNVVIRSAADPEASASAVRAEIKAVDPELPVYNVRTMEDRVDQSLARRRFAMRLLTLFAALALGMAAVGTYGVIAYLVSQATREIGIRIALGASPRGIGLLIVRHGLGVTIAGVAVGVAGALAFGRSIASLLYGVDATDPLTFVAIPLLLGAVAIAACYLPARRAARIDPIVSLRSE